LKLNCVQARDANLVWLTIEKNGGCVLSLFLALRQFDLVDIIYFQRRRLLETRTVTGPRGIGGVIEFLDPFGFLVQAIFGANSVIAGARFLIL
jgi:hypothetical protein